MEEKSKLVKIGIILVIILILGIYTGVVVHLTSKTAEGKEKKEIHLTVVTRNRTWTKDDLVTFGFSITNACMC